MFTPFSVIDNLYHAFNEKKNLYCKRRTFMNFFSNLKPWLLKILVFSVVIIPFFVFTQDKPSGGGVALWARSVSTGSGGSAFYAVAVDASGNVYAGGNIWERASYTFDTGISATGKFSTSNIALVKYDPQGKVQWAQTVLAGPFFSVLEGVAVDSSGNIYIAGYIGGTNVFDFGSGVKVKGCVQDSSVLLVKYDANGKALWARSATAGASWSQFAGLAVDKAGNVYAVGYIWGDGAYTFGPKVSAAGTNASEKSAENALIVKYDSNGKALWARSVSTGSAVSRFFKVAVDGAGGVYAAGLIEQAETYTFGTGVSATGMANSSTAVLVKYNSEGEALWVSAPAVAKGSSGFDGVAADQTGIIYAVGSIYGTSAYTFGSELSVAGSSTGANIVLVRYNPDGTARWARSVSSQDVSRFTCVAVDAVGNAYAVGYLDARSASGIYVFDSDTNVLAKTVIRGYNVVLAKYNPDGKALWASTVTSGIGTNVFRGVCPDQSGNVYAVGDIKGTGTYGFGQEVNATGTSQNYNSLVLVKYTAQ
jgi:hypothetical protein